jgi:polysaccharide pyruvyl transferase WcaK-like protein
MRKITILGSYSGRNAGDVAILASIMEEISSLCPEVEFEVPTTNPSFIKKNYSNRYKVKPISIMPWNLSLRLLGIPVFLSILRTDLTLITNGIIFDIHLFNIAFNFLITLIFLVPFANLVKKPVICYCVGVGPVTTKWGKRFTKFIGNRCNLIMVREEDSYNLMKELGVNPSLMSIYADAAFNNKPSSSGRVKEIMDKEGIRGSGLIGLNVTAYGGTWLENGEIDKSKFQESIANTVDRLIENLKVRVVLITTQVVDIPFAEEIMAKIKKKEYVSLVTNKNYTNHEIMGLMGEFDLFIGMRVHSLILASAMEVPVIGLVYAPKVRSFCKLLGLPSQSIELEEINSGRLYPLVLSTWEKKEEIKEKLIPRVNELKNKALQAAKKLAEEYKNE